MDTLQEIEKAFGGNWFTAREYSPHKYEQDTLEDLVEEGILERDRQGVLIIQRGRRKIYDEKIYRIKPNRLN